MDVARHVVPVLALLAAAVAAQAPAPRLAPGAAIEVRLESALASQTAKIGDPVRAMVERQIKKSGKVILPKGSVLLGRVTEDSLAQKGKMASFGVLFTTALATNGATLLPNLRAAIVRIYPVKKVKTRKQSPGIQMSPELGGPRVVFSPFPSVGVAKNKKKGGPYANFDHTQGKPVAFAVMERFNGAGRDLGGLVMALTPGDIQLKSGANLQVRVLH
jgi:hypothetical protein